MPAQSTEETFHDRLLRALESDREGALAAELDGARAADIAEAFELLRDEDRSRLLFALEPHIAAEVVVMLDEAVRGDVVEGLDTKSLTEIVSEMPLDDAADVLGELTEEEADEILDHMEDARKSDKIEELLEYDEDTAGGIMTPDVVALPAGATVADAVQSIRRATQDEDLNEIYVLDEGGKLVGFVPLRRLVTNTPETRLRDIADDDPVVVFADDDQETVIQVIRKYDVMEAAVVDAGGRLLGRITHDDLLDVADAEAAEDILRMAGTDMAELETSSVLQAARIRLTWLMPCMLGTLVTASVLRLSEQSAFSTVLFASLVLFCSMIGAISGNSGIQISTVIVRGFATGELASTRLARALLREGRISLVIAPVCGIVAWAIVRVFLSLFDYAQTSSADAGRIALAVGTAMTSAMLVAAFLGIALPFSFRRLGVDPAIASGPLVTTLNDVVSVSIYMLLAMLIAT